jgi:hypothetical protein
MAASLASKDAELVLQANQIDVLQVQKVGGGSIAFEVFLRDLKTDSFRIIVPIWLVVHCHDQALGLWVMGGDGFT